VRAVGAVILLALLTTGCFGGGGDDDLFPDVVSATLVPQGGGSFTASVTISSPYDSESRYADGWRILGPDNEVFSETELTHDHADEQPFTRSSGVFAIPEDVTEVTFQGRDIESGWGGGTLTVPVPGRN
jgi:hypothetical protein